MGRPQGTRACIVESFQLVTGAPYPTTAKVVNLTPDAPVCTPNPLPVIVIVFPYPPELGDMPLMTGGRTVYVTVLLLCPQAVTCTIFDPVGSPQEGTVTEMEVSDHVLEERVTAPNFTELVSCVGPKPDPEIVTEKELARVPLVGAIPLIVGEGARAV